MHLLRGDQSAFLYRGYLGKNSLLIEGIVLSQCVEDPNLDLARIPVLLYGSDNLDGDHLSRFDVVAFHHLAKRSLTQLPDYLICEIER